LELQVPPLGTVFLSSCLSLKIQGYHKKTKLAVNLQSGWPKKTFDTKRHKTEQPGSML
jgi:hypothetical protein